MKGRVLGARGITREERREQRGLLGARGITREERRKERGSGLQSACGGLLGRLILPSRPVLVCTVQAWPSSGTVRRPQLVRQKYIPLFTRIFNSCNCTKSGSPGCFPTIATGFCSDDLVLCKAIHIKLCMYSVPPFRFEEMYQPVAELNHC